MKETRMIKVIGTQRDEKGEENTIELLTEGVLYEKNGNIYIVYEETQISGMEGTTTTLKIEGTNKVSMKRFGNTTAQFVFEEGKRFDSLYHTGYGNFKMELVTNHLTIQLNDLSKKGKIEIQYELTVSGLVETVNQLKIEVM